MLANREAVVNNGSGQSSGDWLDVSRPRITPGGQGGLPGTGPRIPPGSDASPSGPPLLQGELMMLTDYQPAPRLPTSGEQLPLPSLPSPAATTPGLEAEQTAIAPEPKVTGSSDGYGLLDPSEPPLTVSGRSADWEALEKSFGVDQLLADLLASPRSPVPPAAGR